MLYLLDTNVLIDAKNRYYPIERIPQFWNWIVQQSIEGNVKVPRQVIDEILDPEDEEAPAEDLSAWVSRHVNALVLRESPIPEYLTTTFDTGYGIRAKDIDVINTLSLIADPFLIAYALASPCERCVVTLEKRKTHQTLPQPQNRRIPLVCDLLKIRYINTFDLIRKLDFRIP